MGSKQVVESIVFKACFLALCSVPWYSTFASDATDNPKQTSLEDPQESCSSDMGLFSFVSTLRKAKMLDKNASLKVLSSYQSLLGESARGDLQTPNPEDFPTSLYFTLGEASPLKKAQSAQRVQNLAQVLKGEGSLEVFELEGEDIQPFLDGLATAHEWSQSLSLAYLGSWVGAGIEATNHLVRMMGWNPPKSLMMLARYMNPKVGVVSELLQSSSISDILRSSRAGQTASSFIHCGTKFELSSTLASAASWFSGSKVENATFDLILIRQATPKLHVWVRRSGGLE